MIVWFYFRILLIFYLSAMIRLYPLYLLRVIFYLAGAVIIIIVLVILYTKRVPTPLPVLGSLLAVKRDDRFLFYRKTDRFGEQSDDSKICVVMVGLPARGKSLIAGKGMFEASSKSPDTDTRSDALSSLGRYPGTRLQRGQLSSSTGNPSASRQVLRSS